MNVAVYAGSFDPFTCGHYSVLEGALRAFDKVIVAIGRNSNKKGLFTPEERVEIVKDYITSYGWFPRRVDVVIFEGLLVEFCKKAYLDLDGEGEAPERVTIVRGLRAVSDFEVEMSIADANRRLHPEFQTVFIPTEADKAFISSSTAKEIARNLPDSSLNPSKALAPYVLPTVAMRLVQALQETLT